MSTARDVIYTFYVESNSTGAESLTPVIEKMISIEDGSDLSSKPSVTELSAGFYKFSFTWDSSSPEGYLIRIDTGLDALTEKYITMRIEKNDYLESLAADIKVTSDAIQTAATSIQASADTIQDKVTRLLSIEEGEWRIVNNQLIITSSDGQTVLGTFDLLDENEQPTSVNPFVRKPVTV